MQNKKQYEVSNIKNEPHDMKEGADLPKPYCCCKVSICRPLNLVCYTYLRRIVKRRKENGWLYEEQNC